MFYFVLDDVWKVLLFSFMSVFTLFVISRIMGKKQIAELHFIDYIIGISIGSIAAEMSIDLSNNPVWYYIFAMLVFLIIDLIVNFLELKCPKVKSFFKGKPSTLIYDGKINYKELRKARLTINDLLSMSRVLGYFNISDIAYAVLETSGDLSILPKGKEKPTTVGDLQENKIKESKLPCYLLVDGKISFSGLNEINKDRNWLYKKLNCKTKKDLKNYILVEFNLETKEIISYKKGEV